MKVENQNLNHLLFFVFNILSIQDKIKFASEFCDSENEDSYDLLFQKYINKTTLTDLNTDEEINFIFYNNPEKGMVDICINGDEMHFNSKFLSPLNLAICDFFSDGLILKRHKIKKNSEIFKKRFYKCYTIVNDYYHLYPLLLN